MARRAVLERITKETRIEVAIDLDGTGTYEVETPLPFLSHMVEQLSRHSMIDLRVRADGDVHIDGHHLTEDLGITIGKVLSEALGDKTGIRRYGSSTLPMDEACVTCAIDLSGRTFYQSKLALPKAKVGQFDSELTDVFFEGFARGAQCNLHFYRHAGENLHHCIEISFKSLARALRDAVELDARAAGTLPSTKGTLAG